MRLRLFIIIVLLLLCDVAAQEGLSRVVITFLQTVKWMNVLIISNKDERIIIRQLSNVLISSQVIKPFSNTYTKYLPIFMDQHQHDRIIVYCEPTCHQDSLPWDRNLFSKKFSWLFIHINWNNLDHFLKLNDLRQSLRVDTEAYIMTSQFSNAQYQVLRIFLPSKKKDDLHNIVVARYNYETWKFEYRQLQEVLPVQDLVFRVGIFHFPPTVTLQKEENSTLYGGSYVELIRMLSHHMGFRYKFIIDKTKTFGSISDNGTWSGIIGMLQRKEIDIGAMSLAITPERFEAVDYVTFLSELHIVGLLRKTNDGNDDFKFFTYLQPFSVSVWIWVLSFGMVVGSCMLASMAYDWNTPRVTHFALWKDSVIKGSWTILSVGLQMGLTDLPRNRSGLIIVVFFAMFVLILSKTYGSLLTAILTVKKTQIQFNKLEDVLADTRYNFAVLKDSSEYAALKRAKSGLLQRIWKNLKANPAGLVASKEDGIDKAFKENTVFLLADSLAQLNSNSNCSLTYIRDVCIKTTLHIVFEKNSPFTEIFSQKILSLRSSGVIKKWYYTYFPKYDPSLCPEGGGSVSIGIYHSVGAFVCLVLACVCSILLLMVERLLS